MSVSDDVDLNSVASIPGMGIPEQLKAAMEQEHSSKSQPSVSNLMITTTRPAGLQPQTHTASFPLRKSQQKSEETKAWTTTGMVLSP